ncbi:MAG: class I SAM-dependent methyltransferase [Candidatus Methylomirabilia bacterium]
MSPGMTRQACPPVLLLVFNRPMQARRVFERIRAARPGQLFIAADGPREGREGERRLCDEARAVLGAVDWDCDVKTLFRDANLGCRQAVSSAISWFLSSAAEGIILEDDCLPDPTFFPFCAEMLSRFRNDDKIMMVSGRNDLGRWKDGSSSYFYTIGNIWGWATWRRAWERCDLELKTFREPAARDAMEAFRREAPALAEEIDSGCGRVVRDEADSWGYPWAFTRIALGGLGVVSSVNLVDNIGFDKDATHTTVRNDALAGVPVYAMRFPLRHASDRRVDFEYYRQCSVRTRTSLAVRGKNRLKRLYLALRRRPAGGATPGNVAAYDGYTKYDGEVARSYEQTREAERHWEQEDAFVGKYIRSRRIETVLDVPVGTGRFFQHYTGVRRVAGVDISLAMLAKARQKTLDQPPGVDFCLIRGDIFSLPFADKAFDAVIVFRLLHLMPEASLDAAVREICRVTGREAVVQTYVPAQRMSRGADRTWASRLGRHAARALRSAGKARPPAPQKPWSHIQAYYHEQAAVDAKFAACGLLPVQSAVVDIYGEADVRITVYSPQRDSAVPEAG